LKKSRRKRTIAGGEVRRERKEREKEEREQERRERRRVSVYQR
jgi:hypothetical protein